MFLGTLSGPFFNHLIGNSSAGFTELILTGERVEVGIRSGKIQKDASLSLVNKYFAGKKEACAIYSPRGQNRVEHRQTVSSIMIPRPIVAPQCNNKQRVERPQRKFTRINMTLAEVLPHLLRSNLASLKEAPKNPNTTSPRSNPNAQCAYHSEIPGHDTNDCWALRNKVQDLI